MSHYKRTACINHEFPVDAWRLKNEAKTSDSGIQPGARRPKSDARPPEKLDRRPIRDYNEQCSI